MATKRKPAKSKRPRATASDVDEALRLRFAHNEWAVIHEVGCRVGLHQRRGDVIAMNLWPSRGLAIHGVEIKVSRGDWLRELKQPEKAESLFGYCDYWWLAVGSRSVVKDGELPSVWGLLEYRGGKMHEVVPAPKLEPTPLDRGFVAELLRRQQGDVDKKVAAVRNEEREKKVQAEYGSELRNLRQQVKDYEKAIRDFEAHSGLDLSYSGRGLGDAVAKLRSLQRWHDPLEHPATAHLEDAQGQLKRLADAAGEQARCIRAMIELANAPETPKL